MNYLAIWIPTEELLLQCERLASTHRPVYA